MFPLLFMNTEPTQRDTATTKEDESEEKSIWNHILLSNNIAHLYLHFITAQKFSLKYIIYTRFRFDAC